MRYKVLMVLAVLIWSQFSTAADIGFGTIKGIKVYDFSADKTTRIYFDDDATNQVVEGCDGVATITHSAHQNGVDQKMLSIALSAYVAGKKVRIASSQNSCEADFIAIQETYF